MRARTLVTLVLGLGLAVGVTGIAILETVDLNRYRGVIAERVALATGRKMTIRGDVRIAPALHPTLVVHDVVLANVPWGSRSDMMTARRLEVQVALLPLLRGHVQIHRLVLVEPDILLETGWDGRSNWTFESPERTPEGDAPEDPFPVFDFTAIEIRQATLAVRNGTKDTVRTFKFARFAATTDGPGGPVILSIDGRLEAVPVQGQGRVGAVADLLSNRPFAIDLTVTVAGATVALTGVIAHPLEGEGIDLLIDGRGSDLAALNDLLQGGGRRPAIPLLPALGPYQVGGRLHGARMDRLSLSDIKGQAGVAGKVGVTVSGAITDLVAATGLDLKVDVQVTDPASFLHTLLEGASVTRLPSLTASGRLTGGDRRYTLAGFRGTLGASDLAGTLTVEGREDQPAVSANLRALIIDAAEIFPAVLGGERPALPSAATTAGLRTNADTRVIPDVPLSLAPLQGMATNLKVKAGTIRLPGTTLTDVEAVASTRQGQLVIETLKAGVAGGQVSLSARAEPTNAGGVTMRLRADGDNVELGRLLTELDLMTGLEGAPASLKASLAGQGSTLRGLAADLSGQVTFATGPARLHHRALEGAGLKLVNELLPLLNPRFRSEAFTEIGCGVIAAVLTEGVVMMDKGLAIETSQVKMAGDGTVALATEKVDIVFKEQSLIVNKGTAIANLLRMRGTLAAPRLDVDEVGLARAATAAIAAGKLSRLGELLAGKASADSDPCTTALGGKPPVLKRIEKKENP